MGSWYVTEVSKNKFIIYNNTQLQSGDSGMPHCLQHGIGSIGCYNITAYFLQEMILIFPCSRLKHSTLLRHPTVRSIIFNVLRQSDAYMCQ